mmetsp:Transcript_17512/g.25912  ORF Transcript_17512/g.25912 Transcript_17512/m.25912 type:complete len:513 (+) Transcript_17512:32-1570(+)
MKHKVFQKLQQVFLSSGSMTGELSKTKSNMATFYEEARKLIALAIPLITIELGSTAPVALTASYVGRKLGPVYLSAFTLSTLTLNLLTLSVMFGLFSATDTLSPQAFGAGNYKEVGFIAMRSYILSMWIIIPANTILFFVMEDLLIFCGQERESSRLAQQWYRVYMTALPFNALYIVTWKFLSVQEVMMPLIITMVVATGVVLPLCLEWLIPTLGFLGSSTALLIHQVAEVIILLSYLAIFRPHQKETWPGVKAWRQSMDVEPLLLYIRLGMGGILASGEWIWWELISLIIGSLGAISLDAHMIPTQLITIAYMIPLGAGTALSIRLGSTLPKDVNRAQNLALWSTVFMIVLFAFLSIGIFFARKAICALFTTDPDVIHFVEGIWWKVVLFYFTLSIFAVFTQIAISLGMQWMLGFATIIILWFIGLPAFYIYTIRYDGGLNAAWSWISPPYIAMNFIFAYRFLSANWNSISLAIREREGISDKFQGSRDEVFVVQESCDMIVVNEKTSLLR